MNSYFIIYDGEDFALVKAGTIEDCIVQFADYVGDKTELFVKALKGCASVKDYVDMYEYFGQSRIDSIFAIGKTIYDRDEDNA